MRRFDTYVTFQQAVTTRTPSGQVTAASYADVADLVDLPARIIAHVEEEAGERRVTTEDLFDIYVQGDQPVRPAMVAVADDVRYDVKRVANPPLRRPMSLVTVVTAQRVSL